MSEGITGENLNLLVGSCPIDDDKLKQKVKENVLKILNEKYYIVEEDFCSAEIQIVPAGKARELGFDKSMILGYGQDDRICAFASLKALSELKEIPEKTSVVILCDKEETGSQGATGMSSFVFENIVAELINMRCENYSDLMLRRCLQNSNMLSADVSSAHDPNYADVSAPNNNMAKLGYGVVIRKYTGARGKVHTNEAEPEFFARLRKILNENKIIWQTAELGKVDLGGGGTIAAELARYGMNVIDCGPSLLNMHAPWEISSKIDAYITYEAYGLFYKLI